MASLAIAAIDDEGRHGGRCAWTMPNDDVHRDRHSEPIERSNEGSNRNRTQKEHSRALEFDRDGVRD